jgi:hypothetical protein
VLNADVTLFCHTSSILWVRFISVLELAGDNDLGVTTEIFKKFCNKGITAAAPSTPRERGGGLFPDGG